MTALHRLHAEQGQSPWLDCVDRALIKDGTLEELIDQGIRGLTSNPTIFAKAIASGQYDELVGRMASQGASAEEVFEEIALGDAGDAADILRPIYEARMALTATPR